MHKDEAQKRVDRIHAFRDELAALEQEDILHLEQEQLSRLNEHHASLLGDFAHRYDIDVSGTDKQLSWGMRIVSFLGALALSAAVFFFFFRFWGDLSTNTQVGILLIAPLLATVATEIAARKEKTLYFASLVSLIAFTCFVLNLVVIGTIFNITPSQNAFIAWGIFALIFAYLYGLRLQLVVGMTCLLGYLAATIGTWSGCYWLSFGERPENFILAGTVMLAAAAIPQRSWPSFQGIYRVYGLLTIFIAILILANWGRISYLPWPIDVIEYSYQAAGFTLAALTIWVGIRCHWAGTSNLGSTFFVLFLYTKLFDWWWDWLPKYLFFLLLGLIAVGLLLVMKRVRTSFRKEAL